jgi:hypothetical protein
MSEIDEEEIHNKDENTKKGITLELGDIIKINAINTAEIHDETFFILYLDEDKIQLANISTFHPYTLKLDKDGRITDESITQIELLSRSQEKGYARQHLLLPKTWIDVYFGGEIPTIITGEITNLEEDMIEITTYPDLATIYIDFEYKGLPEHLPLEQIVIRTKPAALGKITSLTDIQEDLEEGELYEPGELLDAADGSLEFSDTGEFIIRLPESAKPDKNINEELEGKYIEANDIIFGEELEGIKQLVEIPEYKKKLGIQTQLENMMDEFLSNVPFIKRSKFVMDNIHFLIERFRELREQFSKFDTNGNVFDINTVGVNYKPLVDRITTFDTKLKWLIPVSSLSKKIYTDTHPENTPDVIQINIQEDLITLERVLAEYRENQFIGDVPKYQQLLEKMNSSMTPFDSPHFMENYLVPKHKVLTNLESIVNNLDNFYSTVLKSDGYVKRRFVIQKYNLGDEILAPQIMKNGRRNVYVKELITPNESITVKSLITLPEPVIKFSAIDLPITSILKKASLAQNYFYLFRILHEKTDINTQVIKKFNQEFNWEEKGLLEKAQEFLIDEALEHDPDRFKSFLSSALPQTKVVVNLIQKNLRDKLSLKHAVDAMEPFLLYSNHITYSDYNHIRFIIKQEIGEFKIRFANRAAEFDILRVAKYANSKDTNRMENLLYQKRDIFDMFLNAYEINSKMVLQKRANGSVNLTSNEWLNQVLRIDNGIVFFDLLGYMMSTLITPENLLEALEKQQEDDKDDMSKNEKIKAKDCAQRILTKKYTSLKELQKENGEVEIYFDKDYDDTPYDILNKYKDEKKKYTAEEFIEFLEEVLIQKHDAAKSLAKDLAKTLIQGKKRITEGQYAILEIRPKLPANIDESKLSKAQQKDIETEADTRKKTEYYRRLKNQWVHDDEVDEQSFIDSNTLFCNMRDICFKDQNTKKCEDMDSAEERMRQMARSKLIKEFDTRFADSVENIQETIKNRLTENIRQLKKIQALLEIQKFKQNRLAFELGKFAKNENVVHSPHIELRDQILSQDDFIKKQADIVRFVDTYCRDPMVDELGEKPFWKYCRETNTALFPMFLHELAKTFVSGNNYQQKQDELCRKQGVLSDDGDSIVDKHSGYVIKKIDFVEEDGYDESGFKMKTNEVIEKDAADIILESIESSGKKDRVFEDATSQMVFNIYNTLSRNIGLPLESVEDLVIRVSNEVIEKMVKSQASYEKFAAKAEKEKGKKSAPYETYRNQMILIIVAAVLLVAIQTTIPSFKIRKTFPGCVQSFNGYPMNGVEDMTSVKYIACVMNGSKSATEPWKSIKQFNVDILQDRIKKVLSDFILTNIEIVELYAKKRDYLILNPDEEIPVEHAIQKWLHFMPPVIPFTVLKTLKGLSSEYKAELITLMREGKHHRDQISMFKTKVLLYGYGVVESINKTAKSKEMLLKTVSRQPFLENSCCNDKKTVRCLDYFLQEDDTLATHLDMIRSWVSVLSNVKAMSKASMIYHPTSTKIQRPQISTEFNSESIYMAFIYYCNLDSALPIPEHYLEIMSEKPAGYDSKSTLSEKMEFLKSNGHRFTKTNFKHLMEITNRENLVGIYSKTIRGSRVAPMKEFLEYMDSQESTIIEKPLRDRLLAVIANYDPKQMLEEKEFDRVEETKQLNNYLSTANDRMLAVIAGFFQQHGKLPTRKFNQLTEMLANIHMWNAESGAAGETGMYTVVQFLKNSVYNMSRVYPEAIRNNTVDRNKAAKHWDLSPNHISDIALFLKESSAPLQKFKNDPILTYLLIDTQTRLIDLNLFLQTIPVFSPIVKEPIGDKPMRTFNLLFSKRTIYMLMVYLWYSVIYEYIMSTDDEELLHTDLQIRKGDRRESIRSRLDSFTPGESSERLTTELSENDVMNEIQIETGNQIELKQRTCELLLAFLEIEGKTKKTVNLSYADISKKTSRSKQEEKKMITDFLAEMNKDERKVENEKKNAKLGRWSVGMQKGIFQYDKETNERERAEFISRMNQLPTDIGEDTNDPIIRDVDQVERDAEDEVNEFYDREAVDIGGLNEDYMDGAYYSEDEGDDNLE